MTIQQLQQFLATIQSRLQEKIGHEQTDEARTYAYMVKISEEVGELAEQVLGCVGRQDDRKGTFSQENLEKELADVIFTVGLLATHMDIDLEQAITKRKEDIASRYIV